eukprot:CAMPEP_0172608666 /NCGR_PEP_ID=MMETSP1068-20121228/28738_1 /TAXON_ID=35684 /ORGANISM="Pseudopedinella elastica, Strain CCMP716" /LENGTH=35 /DNA_ID= /DNA_START= /DNA_END= /DNA_ORIENTATION=
MTFEEKKAKNGKNAELKKARRKREAKEMTPEEKEA